MPVSLVAYKIYFIIMLDFYIYEKYVLKELAPDTRLKPLIFFLFCTLGVQSLGEYKLFCKRRTPFQISARISIPKDREQKYFFPNIRVFIPVGKNLTSSYDPHELTINTKNIK